MKIPWSLLLSLSAIGTSSAILVGGTIPDPSMVILRGGDATPITGSNFQFAAGPNGGGIYVFTNDTGRYWTQLDFTATVPDPNPVVGQVYTIVNFLPSISGTRFTDLSGQTCSGVLGNFDCVHIVLFQQDGGVSLPPGYTFAIDLNNDPTHDPGVHEPYYNTNFGDQPDGKGGWGAGTVFNGHVNDTPEPVALAMVAAGLGLLGVKRLRRRRAD
jgi:hypothetical protein